MRLRLLFLILLTTSIPPGLAAVKYEEEVKPLLREFCYRCHGANQQKGELRLDTAASGLKGGETGAGFVPGKSKESLLIEAVKGTHDSISRMPYKKPPLSEAQIDLLSHWIDEGAKAPADEKPGSSKHWAFIPPAKVKPPEVKHLEWVRNPIDRFILERLEKEKIKPAVEADRITLLRRLYLDLTGLPPSPGEVKFFLADTSPGAYERWVERLLGSQHYGERWGRAWLDVARYADSNGYSVDAPRSIWKYREWVIKALNADMPFDRFVIEQLAGDLLPNATLEQKIATGFNRNTQINQEGGIDPEQFRVESVMDRVNTTATAFLGLTLACAQCHDHKFDPLSQKEYYQFYAFFNSTIPDGHGGDPAGMLEIPGEIEPADNLRKELEEAEADLDRYLDTKGGAVVKWEQSLTPEAKEKLKEPIRKFLAIAFADRTRNQKRTVYTAFRADDSEFKQRNTKLSKLEKLLPKPVTTLVMVERPEPRESVVFIKGDFTRPGAKVTPDVPAILETPLPRKQSSISPENDRKKSEVADSNPSKIPVVSGKKPGELPAPDAVESKPSVPDPLAKNETLPNRLDLARWMVDPQNPMTARVTVNRIWQQYFGRGIVETENDFGTQGIPPTHPELLNWLANELIARQWSIKEIHRLIVNSATYRQSSRVRPDLATIDPNNKFLARQSRLRLDAEVVRDISLSASGLLHDRIGGPSVFPPQPNGVMTLGQFKRDWTPSAGPDRYRRGLYTFFWRATPHPALAVFDAPDGFSSCTRRLRSNTPLQALTLLNDQQFFEFAEAMGNRILKEGPQKDEGKIEYAFGLCLGRPASVGERTRVQELLSQQLAQATGTIENRQRDAWTTVARVLLNLDETITRE